MLLAGVAAMLPSTTFAQQASEAAGETRAPADAAQADSDSDRTGQGDIVVTGSRIRRSSADTPSPVTVVNAEQIRSTGLPQIADVVNQLPSLAITQTDQTSNLAGNPGINALDLRGLGTKRTLVLVDGRRQVPAIPGSSAVDLSTIPSNLVQRVEIVTGGASAQYGADAVAGVANFILKRDYQGIDSSWRYGASTRGDLDDYAFDLLAGTNFAEGRGNATIYGFYENSPDTVSGQDRSWTAGNFPIYSRAAASTGPYTVQEVRPIYAADTAQVLLGGKLYTFTADGRLRQPVLGPGGLTNATRYDLTDSTNIGNLQTDGGEYGGRYDSYYLQVPSERVALHGSLNYRVSDALKPFLIAQFSHNSSESASASWAEYGYSGVPADSPFVTDEIRAANGGASPDPLYFARRFPELGVTRTEYDYRLYQVTLGAEGDFSLLSKPWNYSFYYSFGQTRELARTVDATATNRYYQALDSTTGTAGQPVCRSTLSTPGDGCVPLNPFKTLTQAEVEYLHYSTSPAKATLSEQVASGYVSGGLFDLPGGAVQAVLGAEYRRENNNIGATPEYDPSNPAYDPSLGVTQTPLAGRYDVKEAFGELHVPLLANTAFFHLLSFDGALRFSNYSTAGKTTTYKLGAEYAPVRDLRFRATFGKAVRAPNISELFTQNSISGAYVSDPCNAYNLAYRTTRTQYTAVNCAALNPSDTATYYIYPDIISTGNAQLGVETAKTLTIGAVLQPRFLKGFALTLDYYNIDLRDSIDQFLPQTIIDRCVDAPTLANRFCGYVMRDASGNIASVTTQSLNLAKYINRGIDIEATYNTKLGFMGLGASSALSVDAAFTRLLNQDYTLDPSDLGTVLRTAGVFGSPKWKGVVRSTYSETHFSLTWTARYFSPMRQSTQITKAQYQPAYTPSILYNDFSASYQLTSNIQLAGGLTNAFDRAPPRVPGAEAGGANFELGYQAGVYDVIGRTFFATIRYTR